MPGTCYYADSSSLALINLNSSGDSSSARPEVHSRSRSHSSSNMVLDSRPKRKEQGDKRPARGGRGGGRGGGGSRPPREHSVPFPSLDGPLWDMEQFGAEHQKGLPEDKLRKLYFFYKRKWDNQQKEEFFKQHKDDIWVQDKYNPEKRFLLQEERFSEARVNQQTFLKQYNLGRLNSINLTVTPQQLQEMATGNDIINLLENREIPFFELQLKEHVDISDSPFFAVDPNDHTLFIKQLPESLSRWAILEVVQTLPGFNNFSVSAPVKANDMQRMGWIGFDSEQAVQSALAGGVLKVKSFTLPLSKQQERRKGVRVCSSINSKKLYKDYLIQRDLIQTLDKEKKLEANPLTQGPAKDREDPTLIRSLDLQTIYLRKVHAYCYWSGGEFQTERVLSQKCGCTFLRVVTEGYKSSHENINWQKAVQKLAKKRIEDSKADLTVQEPFQELLDKEFEKVLRIKSHKSQKLQMEIFPCQECQKQFKGAMYLIKHIYNKHPPLYEEQTASLRQNVIDNFMIETYRREKLSKIAIQKVVFGNEAKFSDFDDQPLKIVQPINFVPRPQQRAYKDLDNIVTERTVPQNIILPLRDSAINYNDI